MLTVKCIAPFQHILTVGRVYDVVAFNRERYQVRVRGDHGRLAWITTDHFAVEDTVRLLPPYTIWIEAECWLSGSWDEDDGNTNVHITFADGTCWGATCVTYRNVASLTAKNQRTGECMDGKYLWISEIVLVDKISRERIEEVVQYMLAMGEFEQAWTRYPDHDPNEEED